MDQSLFLYHKFPVIIDKLPDEILIEVMLCVQPPACTLRPSRSGGAAS